MDYELELSIQSTDRRSVRNEVVATWLAEAPGGREIQHRYRYNVERLADGNRIYLKRPARLNKGMDFVIYCDGFHFWKNGNCKPPSHKDLLEEIKTLSCEGTSQDGERRREIARAIGRIWNCEKPESVVADLRLTAGLRAERLLKLARWLFIEQDLTYWTASGRWMLREEIEKQLGESLGEW